VQPPFLDLRAGKGGLFASQRLFVLFFVFGVILTPFFEVETVIRLVAKIPM
jgi:hypothetical protein